MNNTLYPSKLSPDSTESYTIAGSTVDIPVVHKLFKEWQGPAITNTFGGKPLVDYQGVPMFAELAIQRLAVESGWQSRWVETYSMKSKAPYFFTDWIDAKLGEQPLDPITDITQTDLLTQVAKLNDSSYYGCWDVIAWSDEKLLFLESKRSKKDSIRSTQLAWVEAGMATGLSADNFLIVQWGFSLDELT